MSSPVIEPLRELADAWRAATAASRRRAATAFVALGWVIALLVARQGTVRGRSGAAVIMVASLAVGLGWRAFERRGLRRPEGIVRGLARRVDAAGADRVLRALSLVGPDGAARATEGTSGALARLHVARAIALLPSERIVERAARMAKRVGVAALGALGCALAIGFVRFWSVVEGADVLVARRGVAPVTIRWLDDIDVLARPPDYLHEAERHGLAFVSLGLPYGTLVTVRGTPLHAGRHLLLSDGTKEVPLVDDGSGAVVARWHLTETTNLRVIARFGGVAIPEPEALTVESIPDEPPIVTLEGAPRQVLLVDQDEDIPIRYDARDDHGLREIQFVLRSASREERRVLVRLDGETRRDKGGYLLKLRDPFLKKSHAPIELTVEAKDNDPLTGPKWGASPVILLVPPSVGEPEALRLDALRRLRDALVDALASRLSGAPPAEAQAKRVFIAEETRRAAAIEALFEQTMNEVYAGARVPLRIRATLAPSLERLRKAADGELKHPSRAAHDDVVKSTEHFVLVVDAAVRQLGLHDARESARQLADVADDLALGASQMHADARSSGALHMDAATTVLAAGGHEMKRLGGLGRDLSEIIDSDLMRVKRARDGADLVHAELAARDLAARLHEPDPSFGARGSSLRRAGGESGGARGTAGDEALPPDDVDQAFREAAMDVEQLAQDHAGEVAKTEQALAGATSDEEVEALRQEAKQHAEAIREAVRGLPSVGNGSDSWTSKGAAARELSEQMARSLEGAHSPDAVQSGRSAIGALDEAKKILQKGGWIEDPNGETQGRIEAARRKLDVEEKWVEGQLDRLRRRAAERARKQLQQGAEEEGKLADRARDLAQRARDRGSLPQQVAESIGDAERAARQAADSLQQGDAENGLNRQREAQRNLEAAREQLHGDDEANDSRGTNAAGHEGNDGRPSASQGNVPLPGEHKGPEEFRRRVVRGLGQPANGALKDAVRRYAEGLLR